ncbi:MFS transporter [Aspergillus homomorphus CBS 101889]|uniref:MFS general substrate transporter n=1 Tax=Aspergillus homomorphus (strain CBS 101889) TaxID=1450537 RepID=A0A395HUL1_ASPHC|nr:MFS general substrate transporter [Aspergillus homomorphus CBS 101889]RAL11622.1 MFS general substrate transporter [Aspergillus homomorphus CBS 101889]
MWNSHEEAMNRPPRLLRWRSSTEFIIATVWTSFFTDYFLYAMIVPVMPTALVDRASIPYEDREFWVSILLMCEAAVAFLCCPVFGYMLDAAPTRQMPYLLGLIFLGGSMVLLALAHTITLFIVARLLQGAATAMVAVAGLALLTDSVTTNNLGHAIGYLGSAIALGFLLGPLLGGLVYRVAGYQAVFAIAFAMVGIDLLMRIAVIEKTVAKRWMQKPGAVADGPTPSDSLVVQSAESTITASPAHAYRPRKKPAPLLLIIRQPRVLISSGALLVHGLLYSAFDATIPIFVESHFGWTSFGAGMAFLPSALTAFFEPYFGKLTDTHGPRRIALTSFTLLPIPLLCLSLITTASTTHIILLLTLLTIIGLLINLCTPALYLETQQVLDEMEDKEPGIFGPRGAVAQAFALQTMAQFLGLFLGPLWGGFVEWRFGWGVMTFGLAGLVGLTAVFVGGMGAKGVGSGSGSGSGWMSGLGRCCGCGFGRKDYGRGDETGVEDREALLPEEGARVSG